MHVKRGYVYIYRYSAETAKINLMALSIHGIVLWLLIWLVNYVAMLLVFCQLSRDVIGYEDS